MDLLTANDRQGEYPRSYYADTATHLDSFPAAKGALTCDVCVVGAGFTGMSAAYHLAKRGYDVIVLDAQRVGFGASGRNGGQVSMGQRRDQEDLEQMVGDADARKLWDIGLSATFARPTKCIPISTMASCTPFTANATMRTTKLTSIIWHINTVTIKSAC